VLDFPNVPTDGQIFNAAGVSWMWDGTKWTSVLSAGGPFLPLAGGSMTGPLNFTATGGNTSRSAQDRAADTVNVRDYGAKGDVRNVTTNISVSNGSAALVVSTALFSAADVGKLLYVTTARADGTDWGGTITAVTDATHVTLDQSTDATLTTVSRNVVWGTSDTTAILAAVARLPTTGGALYFSQGDYMLTAPITLLSQVTVFGHTATITAGPWRLWTSPAYAMSSAFTATSQSNITVRDMRFVWTKGHNNYGLGTPHILFFTSCSRVRVLDCHFVGGSDATAMIACSDTLVQGNTSIDYSNCAWDHWDAMHDTKVIGNWSSVLTTETNPGIAAISFTGTDGSISTDTSGFICANNFVIANNIMAAICINSLNTGSLGSHRFIVANNTVVTNNAQCWGVLVNGTGYNGIIHDNYLEGGAGSFQAIAIQSPATGVLVHNNTAVNWNGSTGGVFYNASVGGTLTNNTARGCSSPLIGTCDATTVIYGNTDGTTSAVNLANVNVSGPAAFSGTLTAQGGLQSWNGALFGYNGGGGIALTLNSAVGPTRGIKVQTNGLDRWLFGGDATVEGGSNAGSDFQIYRFNDAGSPVGAAVTVTRSSGRLNALFGLAVTGNAGFNNTTPIAKPTVTGSKGANAALASLLTALAAYGLVTDSST
jgi:hypothetical protein